MENGKILREIAKEFYKDIKIGTNIVDLADKYEQRIIDKGKKPLFPVSIEINNIINNYSPMEKYYIGSNDLVSYTLGLSGLDNKEYVKCSYSRSMSGLHDDIIEVCKEACNAGLRNCGPDARLYDIRYYIDEILQSITTVTNVCGHSLNDTRRLIPNKKEINPNLIKGMYNLKSKLEVDENVVIDVYGTDAAHDLECKIYPYYSMYYRTYSKYPLKLRSERSLLTFIEQNYERNIFSLRRLRDTFEKATGQTLRKKTLESLRSNGLISGVTTGFLPTDKNDEGKPLLYNVAHIAHTVKITEKGSLILC